MVKNTSSKVAVFDTTLRDGEQAAGTRLGSRDKLTLARQLARLKVDIIEAGYPASSPDDFEAVKRISQEIEGPAICALSRAVPDDIEACGKALAKAKRPRIHTGIGVSDIHIMGKFRDDRYGKTLGEKKAKMLQMAVDAVKRARELRQRRAVLRRRRRPRRSGLPVRDAAGRHRRRRHRGQHPGHHRLHGARAIRRADPRHPRERAQHPERATISVHCHDDLGLAVANSLAGILQRRAPGGRHHQRHRRTGRQRRAGRSRHGPAHARRLSSASTPASTRASSTAPAAWWPTCWACVFPPTRPSWAPTPFLTAPAFTSMDSSRTARPTRSCGPRMWAWATAAWCLTARTGRARPARPAVSSATRFPRKNWTSPISASWRWPTRSMEVFDEDLVAIMHDELHPVTEICQLEYLHIYSGTSAIPTATVRLRVKAKLDRARPSATARWTPFTRPSRR